MKMRTMPYGIRNAAPELLFDAGTRDWRADVCAGRDRPIVAGPRELETAIEDLQSNWILERVVFAALALATIAGVIACCMS